MRVYKRSNSPRYAVPVLLANGQQLTVFIVSYCKQVKGGSYSEVLMAQMPTHKCQANCFEPQRPRLQNKKTVEIYDNQRDHYQ